MKIDRWFLLGIGLCTFLMGVIPGAEAWMQSGFVLFVLGLSFENK